MNPKIQAEKNLKKLHSRHNKHLNAKNKKKNKNVIVVNKSLIK